MSELIFSKESNSNLRTRLSSPTKNLPRLVASSGLPGRDQAVEKPCCSLHTMHTINQDKFKLEITQLKRII